jgi:hypothetical protein
MCQRLMKAHLRDKEDQESINILSSSWGVVNRFIVRVRVSNADGFWVLAVGLDKETVAHDQGREHWRQSSRRSRCM